jgi:aminopeptidase YwaD
MQAINQLLNLLQTELSGARALDTTATVARYNRITGSTDYAKISQLLCTQLQQYGLDEVRIEEFPIDGQITYADRVFGPAWEPRGAKLEVVAPERYVICDFAITPMCVPSGCPPTAPEGITIHGVVDVGRGDRAEDYADLDVAGKAVLATGLTTDVYNLAVEEFGAACVLTTNMYDWSEQPGIRRTMVDLPDATHLARLYHDPHKRRPAPTFSITYRHAQQLRALASRGPVTLHAIVDADNSPGTLLEVLATIRGADLAAEEVWIAAHLCHPKPGACDNGSGVALGVEIFRTFAELIRQGALPRPRRTLRLLLLPEVSGTQAYMDRYRTSMQQVKALINLDMVGASPTTGAYCRLVQTPWSRPSFLNHLGAHVMEQVSLGSHSHIRPAPVRDWLYAMAPYDKGSDHDVTLNSIFSIPSLFFFYWPYRYYHTDLDTLDKLDPREFERTGAVAALLAWFVATPTTETALALADLAYIEARRELAALAGNLAVDFPAGVDATAVDDRLWAVAEREKGVLQSIVENLPGVERARVAHKCAALQAELAEVGVLRIEPATRSQDGAVPVDIRRPVRQAIWSLDWRSTTQGAPTGKEQLAELRAAVSNFDDKAIAALNYVNSARTVNEITRLVAAELGDFPLNVATQFFDLAAAGQAVTWIE